MYLPVPVYKFVYSMPRSLTELVDWLSKLGAMYLYTDGGRTIQAFHDAGLLERPINTWAPILIGEGIPLSGLFPPDVWL